MTRILVVDDSLSVRKALEKILNLHAEVVIARSAEDALEQLHGSNVAPDLVITDVLMPGMSGFDLAGELRRLPLTANTPVMLMSGIIDDEVHRLAHEVGARTVVRKPFTAEELLPVIRQTLAGQNGVTPPGLQSETAAEDPRSEPELLNDDARPAAHAIAAETVAQPGAADLPFPVVQPASEAQTIPVTQPAPVSRPAAARAAPFTGNPFNLPAATLKPALVAVEEAVSVGAVNEVTVKMPAGPPVTASAAQSLVTTLTEKPGVQGAVVTTRLGEPLAEAGVLGLTGADLGMYARFFANTASALGGRLSGGDSGGVQLDYARCTLLILPLDATQMLVCLLADANSVSMVRFAVRRHLTPVLN